MCRFVIRISWKWKSSYLTVFCEYFGRVLTRPPSVSCLYRQGCPDCIDNFVFFFSNWFKVGLFTYIQSVRCVIVWPFVSIVKRPDMLVIWPCWWSICPGNNEHSWGTVDVTVLFRLGEVTPSDWTGIAVGDCTLSWRSWLGRWSRDHNRAGFSTVLPDDVFLPIDGKFPFIYT